MHKEEAVGIARETGWLSRQPQRFQDDVLRRCHLSTRREGEAIYRTGDPAGGVFGLVDGIVQVGFADDRLGSIRTRGAWFGEAAAFRSGVRLVTMTATTPVSLLVLPLAEFERLIADAEHCRCFALLMADRLEEALTGTAELLERNSLARVCGRLVALSSAQPTPTNGLRLTQAELGAMCGITRATVNRVLGQLNREGAIDLKYGHIRLREQTILLRHMQHSQE